MEPAKPASEAKPADLLRMLLGDEVYQTVRDRIRAIADAELAPVIRAMIEVEATALVANTEAFKSKIGFASVRDLYADALKQAAAAAAKVEVAKHAFGATIAVAVEPKKG